MNFRAIEVLTQIFFSVRCCYEYQLASIVPTSQPRELAVLPNGHSHVFLLHAMCLKSPSLQSLLLELGWEACESLEQIEHGDWTWQD